MVTVSWRLFNQDVDFTFFQELVSHSGKWKKNELKEMTLAAYLERYVSIRGEWRIWEQDGTPVALSFHVDSAPSNQKPWIGTVLVKPSKRRQGIASSLLSSISSEMKAKKHKALFAGIPYDEYEWINFLTDCGFEQFKTEDNEGVIYLIMVRPL